MPPRTDTPVTNPNESEEFVALITKLQPQSDADIAIFKDWLIELMMASANFPGFFSSEIVPPGKFSEGIWTLIQKFHTPEAANAWKQSESLKELKAQNEGTDGAKAKVISQELSSDGAAGMVATAIVTDVIPESLDAFKKWELKIQKAQARFPGYLGTYWQPPVLSNSSQFTTLLLFDTPDSLEHWLQSSVRQELLTEATEHIESIKFSSFRSAFPGWFPADPATGKQPPNWKTSMLVLAALFPIIMLCIGFVEPHFESINFTVFNFCSTVVNMILVTWVCMPVLIKTFSWWLFPKPEQSATTNLKGIGILIAVYAVEIGLFFANGAVP